MKIVTSILVIFSSFLGSLSGAQSAINTDDFDKIIISPHIETTLIPSEENKVVIESSSVDESKINIEVNGHTLRVYLEGAKEWTKTEKIEKDGYKTNRSIYKGKVVTATIYFKNIDELSIRGEQNHKVAGTISGDDFDLTIYGESIVDIDAISCNELKLVTYGESIISVKEGQVNEQKIKCYGESKADLLAVLSNTVKVTTYGESELKLNVSEEIKVTSYGESKLQYKGNAVVKKGLSFGESSIIRL